MVKRINTHAKKKIKYIKTFPTDMQQIQHKKFNCKLKLCGRYVLNVF